MVEWSCLETLVPANNTTVHHLRTGLHTEVEEPGLPTKNPHSLVVGVGGGDRQDGAVERSTQVRPVQGKRLRANAIGKVWSKRTRSRNPGEVSRLSLFNKCQVRPRKEKQEV